MNVLVVLGMLAFTAYWWRRALKRAVRVDRFERKVKQSEIDKALVKEMDQATKDLDQYYGPYGD